MINITFPDGAVREFESGVTTFDIAQSISNSLAKKALAGKFNGKLIDTTRAITEDGSIEIVTPDHEDALPILRHSAAHLFAQAARRLFPDIHLGVGPAIEDGFYYDTDNEAGQISNEDLPRIEEEMKKIVKENFPSIREEVTKDEAREIFKNDPYKLELIEEHSEDEGGLTIYRQGEYVDLCRGPHVPSTGRIQVFHLLNVAGAYWRGNSDNAMMQRIYCRDGDDSLFLFLQNIFHGGQKRFQERTALERFVIDSKGNGKLFFERDSGEMGISRQEKIWQQRYAQTGFDKDGRAFRRFCEMKIGEGTTFHTASLQLKDRGWRHTGYAQDQRCLPQIGEGKLCIRRKGMVLWADTYDGRLYKFPVCAGDFICIRFLKTDNRVDLLFFQKTV